MFQGFHHKLSYTWKPWGGNRGVHPEWYSSPCKDPFTSQMLGELPVQLSKFSPLTKGETSWGFVGSLPSESIGNVKGHHESHELHQAGGASHRKNRFMAFWLQRVAPCLQALCGFPRCGWAEKAWIFEWSADDGAVDLGRCGDVTKLGFAACRSAKRLSGYPLI